MAGTGRRTSRLEGRLDALDARGRAGLERLRSRGGLGRAKAHRSGMPRRGGMRVAYLAGRATGRARGAVAARRSALTRRRAGTGADAARIAAAVAAGAAGAYYLDPNDGRRRRHVARDRMAAIVRRAARRTRSEAGKTAVQVRDRVKGAAHEVAAPERPPAGERLNDPALKNKVETEIFRDPDLPQDAVNVNVEHGVVYLRGEVPSRDEMQALTEGAREVEGVAAVENLLHLPGEPAPTK